MNKTELKQLIKEMLDEADTQNNIMYMIKAIDTDGSKEWYRGQRVSPGRSEIEGNASIVFFDMQSVNSAVRDLAKRGMRSKVYSVPMSDLQERPTQSNNGI